MSIPNVRQHFGMDIFFFNIIFNLCELNILSDSVIIFLNLSYQCDFSI